MKSGTVSENAPGDCIHKFLPTESVAAPSRDEMQSRIDSGLSHITMMLKPGLGWSGEAVIRLWGKDLRNSESMCDTWSEFSQFVMVTLQAKGIDFMEASWSNEKDHR